jgi:hypothetical protein
MAESKASLIEKVGAASKTACSANQNKSAKCKDRALDRVLESV